MALEQGSMRHVINSVYQILIKDEELLRLLSYFPKDGQNPDPLSEELPDLVDEDSDDYWNLIDERFKLAEKTSDLLEEPICRIYISSGRRRPVFNNYLHATQEILISIYTHENYESDMRSEWLSDRVQELLSLERIEGIYGKLDYVAGNPKVAPTQYKRYDQIYEFNTNKK